MKKVLIVCAVVVLCAACAVFFLNRTKKPRNTETAEEILKLYDSGKMNEEEFLRRFGKTEVFYSTPFGDHKDGSQKLFLLPARDNTGYLPVFASREALADFCEKVGRTGYVSMEGTLLSVLETTAKTNVNAPVKMGIIIDPAHYGITIDAAMLDKTMEIIKQ